MSGTILALSLLTRTERGAVRVIPDETHRPPNMLNGAFGPMAGLLSKPEEII